ncbi:MAG: hypothetical protein CVU71_16450 [Deltaproteobacteria bacterium HGW-Deltaproteobacteria-6]|nr:MAG: hypothetical protein CVU71_16450 [Deltaproteobacteria bacterium HGW-Deltaproteobacteria-6]
MDNQQMAKEMFALNKSMLDNTFNMISSVQDQSARMVTTAMEKTNWMPEEGKKFVNDWVSAYQKRRNDFKMIADEKYKYFTSYFVNQESTGAAGMKM